MVAVEGWEKVSDKTAISLALAMKDIGVKTIVYTVYQKMACYQDQILNRQSFCLIKPV